MKRFRNCLFLCSLLLAVMPAGGQPARDRMLGGRSDFEIHKLPRGALRSRLESLPAPARERATRWLQSFEFPPEDLRSLRADDEGGIFYVDEFPLPPQSPAPEEPQTAEAAVPVSPFPEALKFHSRPGAPNVIFLDFDGADVTGTAWNNSLGRDPIPATTFSTDSDFTTFSDAEQLAIKRIWQRVAEDYASFDVDVTTEAPATWNNRTAHLLVTRNTDSNGQPNPSSSAGGVAYVNVFNTSNYSYYRPAWVYYNNLSSTDHYAAEAASHELGHNFGLSHDGQITSTGQTNDYYSGHGAGDISWGPIMGTGYGRNVTQWSKGEYTGANNTQDDLVILAGKLGYRANDHGSTFATASFLTTSDGTNIVCSTPENDPANTNTVNKGIIEQGGSSDMFAFSTGAGQIRLTVNPWISPSGTRGGNLDASVQLYDSGGALVLSTNPPDRTYALFEPVLPAGVYFLEVTPSGAGDPFAASPSGYTPYGSLSQYFISGYIRDPEGVATPPWAELDVSAITQVGQTSHVFTVTYSDNVAINVSTIGSGDINVTGPFGYSQEAAFLSVDVSSNGTPRAATYAITPPGGGPWLAAHNGLYSVWMLSNQVADVEGSFVNAQILGVFTCNVPSVIYSADMSTDPGWILEGLWAHGQPTGQSDDPSSGATGVDVIGYNLTGGYARNLALTYAITPPIDCGLAETAVVQFQRWLGVQQSDSANIEISSDGTSWTTIWTSSREIFDAEWILVQYDITPYAAGRTNVQIRWGMGSNSDGLTSCGWNLDDVQLVGSITLDTAPPSGIATLSDITEGGSPFHEFTVAYTDDTAIAVASLGVGDILVEGPGSFLQIAEFGGVDLTNNGTPRVATYQLAAPGGTWDFQDNGVYQLTLVDGEVSDTAGNLCAESLLGSFSVNIPEPPDRTLTVSVEPADWGSVEPGSGTYPDGADVVLSATPGEFFAFLEWRGDLTGVENPGVIVMTNDRAVTAVFTALETTNYSIPLWWLNDNGFTGDLEQAVTNLGANNLPVWASYVAGLDPNNPTSQFLVAAAPIDTNNNIVLDWNAISGRVYTVLHSTNILDGLTPLVELPWTQHSWTSQMNEASGFFGVRVHLE